MHECDVVAVDVHLAEHVVDHPFRPAGQDVFAHSIHWAEAVCADADPVCVRGQIRRGAQGSTPGGAECQMRAAPLQRGEILASGDPGRADGARRAKKLLHSLHRSRATLVEDADGLAEAVEFKVDENTENLGVPLKKLRIKKGIIVACITHQEIPTIPNGDSYFEQGDSIILITKSDKVVLNLNDIFG